MAKFRAVRKLWARVEAACGLTPKPAMVTAETAWRMMTRRDAYVNMLRNAIAVTAAGLGGADAITMLPHTAPLGLPDAFARRAARNTQLLLARRIEPRACRRSGRGLGRARSAYGAALHRRLVAVSRDRKSRRRLGSAGKRIHSEKCRRHSCRAPESRRARQGYADRHQCLSGHSRDKPTVLDVAPLPSKKNGAAPGVPYRPSRCRASGSPSRSKTCATAPMRSSPRPARGQKSFSPISASSANSPHARPSPRVSFEAGGIEAVSNDGFASLDEMVAAFKASGAALACLCSSDEVYAREATDRGQSRSHP